MQAKYEHRITDRCQAINCATDELQISAWDKKCCTSRRMRRRTGMSPLMRKRTNYMRGVEDVDTHSSKYTQKENAQQNT